MKIPGIQMYQVDAFTGERFKGNPAAVCILDREIADGTMASIAAEMNLSETAFLYAMDRDLVQSDEFRLRWFTPKEEVPLCGHATLATSYVLFQEIGNVNSTITFVTESGELIVTKEKRGITMDFPADVPADYAPKRVMLDALGVWAYKAAAISNVGKRLLIELDDVKHVKRLKPEFKLLGEMYVDGINGVIVTARGEPPHDFVSRYFAPWRGVDEDPVTGAAHTVLAPYWSKALDKKEMLAYQVSRRGGEIALELNEKGRVKLTGRSVVVLRGELFID